MRWCPVFALLLLLSACSGADEGVRTIGSEPASGSGSASGVGSQSASGTSSSADGTACAPPSEPSDTGVTVTLQEYAINVPGRIPAGTVTVTAGNIGGENHEVVIARADDVDALPVSDGQVQEDRLPAGALIGEIESFPAGDTCTGTFELPAGDYVFFCNIVETEPDGTIESHYEQGMRTAVTVG